MLLWEEGLEEYLEETSVFPHPKKEEEKNVPQKPKKIQDPQKAELRRIYKILGLTARGRFPKTAAQKRVEKLMGRERN